jgi:hypothetical protein
MQKDYQDSIVADIVSKKKRSPTQSASEVLTLLHVARAATVSVAHHIDIALAMMYQDDEDHTMTKNHLPPAIAAMDKSVSLLTNVTTSMGGAASYHLRNNNQPPPTGFDA